MDELHRQILSLQEIEKKYDMTVEQTGLIINRVLLGDLDVSDGMIELQHAHALINAWEIGDPLPFGEIK